MSKQPIHLAIACAAALSAVAQADQFYATQVVGRVAGADQLVYLSNPNLALDGPRGMGDTDGGIDVYNLGVGGSITLGFDDGSSGRVIADGPGVDFVVFENAIYPGGDTTRSFAELMFVEVSSNGVDYARFAVSSLTPGPVGPRGSIQIDHVSGFAGVYPVYANVDDPETVDPFDPAVAGGDAFDLSALSAHPSVVAGAIDLSAVRYVRLLDVLGNGSLLDSAGRPIYDATGGDLGGINNGTDLDSVAVIHGADLPNQWKGPGGGQYHNGTNWSSGSPPTGMAATARFGRTITAPATVTVDQALIVAELRIDSPVPYTLGGAASLTLQASDGSAAVVVAAGQHVVTVPLFLASDTLISGSGVLQVGHVNTSAALTVATDVMIDQLVGNGSLSIQAGATVQFTGAGPSEVSSLNLAGAPDAWEASLDIGTGRLTIDTGQLQTIANQVQSGSITSSSADSTHGVGYAFDGGDVVVRYTFYGDADLDGQVNVADLGSLASNWQGTGKHWYEADFNHDGVVNVADLGALASNWQQAMPGAFSSVPEPGSLVLLVAGSGVVLGRRSLARKGVR